jgi:hypothetical protein
MNFLVTNSLVSYSKHVKTTNFSVAETLFHPATWKTLDTLQEIVFFCLLGPIYGKQINTIKQV